MLFHDIQLRIYKTQKGNSMKLFPATDCPFYLITKASLSITSVLKRVLARNGLSEVKPAYLGVLMCLWTRGGMDEMLDVFYHYLKKNR